MNRKLSVYLIPALLVLSLCNLNAREIVYPGLDGFVVDVTAAPYNADPTGAVDSSAAILAAVTYARSWPVGVPLFVYFPNGRYRVEQPVVLDQRTPGGAYIMMQGQSRDGVVLFVPDNTPAFADAAAPKAAISYFEGDWTNNGFLNTFENFTIEVGAGNPGAIGVRFQGNNVTRMSNVTIRSLDPEGVGSVGLDVTTAVSAPALAENIRIEGFEVGIATNNRTVSVYSWVFRNVELENQRTAGIRSYRRALTFHRLHSVNTVPVLDSMFLDGNIVILDAQLDTPVGETVDGPAIIGNGDFFYLRDVVVNGYTHLIDDNGTLVPADAAIASWRNGPAYKVWEDSPEDFLHLPYAEFPEVPWDAPQDWLVLEAAGRSDHTEYLREALQSGAETIFLKPGKYTVNDSIRIGPSVKRIASNFAQIELGFPLVNGSGPVFELGRSNHPAVVIEQIWGQWQQNISNYLIHNRSNADLILRDIFWISGGVYRNDPAGGRLFVSNVANVPGGQQFRPDLASWIIYDQQTWAYQFNPEMALPMLTVSGGEFWMFGSKFGEQQGPMVYARDQAQVEILGGVMNVSHGVDVVPRETPIFHITDAQVTATVVERAGEINGPPTWNFRHRFISEEYRDGEQRKLPTTDPMVIHRDSLSRNGLGMGGAMIPLYTSRYPADATSVAPQIQVLHPPVADLANGAFLIAQIDAVNGPGVPSTHWSAVSGPGYVSFDDPAGSETIARFGRVGDYVLGLRVRNGLHEQFTTFEVSVILGDELEIRPPRPSFRRLDDRAPRDGIGNSALEALLLRTGDEAVNGQSQDNDVRIHMEVDVHQLAGAQSQIRTATWQLTPRALVNPGDITAFAITDQVFGVVTPADYARAAMKLTGLEAVQLAVNQPVRLDVTEGLRAAIVAGHDFAAFQMRGVPNDDSINNYVEWYSPDRTVSFGYRPVLTVYGNLGNYSIWDGFTPSGDNAYLDNVLGEWIQLGSGWAWIESLNSYAYVLSTGLTQAWVWTPADGWNFVAKRFFPWVYSVAEEDWNYRFQLHDQTSQ